MCSSLDTSLINLEKQLVDEQNTDELKQVVDLFNLNLQKKNIIRGAKLSEVQDKIVQQISDRFDHRADEFSNDDLIKYHKIVQETLDKTVVESDAVKTPHIQINQQINNTFSSESRNKIIDAVNQLIAEEKEGEV